MQGDEVVGALESGVRHVADGVGAGVIPSQREAGARSQAVQWYGTLIEMWLDEHRCERASDALEAVTEIGRGDRTLPATLRDRVESCSTDRWGAESRRLADVAEGLRVTRLSISRDDARADELSDRYATAQVAYANHLRQGLSEGRVEVADEAGVQDNMTLALAELIEVHIERGRCESARQSIVGFENAEPRSQEARDRRREAQAAFDDACGADQRRSPGAGIAFLTIGGAALASGVVWDIANGIGPRSELDELRVACESGGDCDWQRMEALEDDISSARLPIGILLGAGGALAITGTVMVVRHGKKNRSDDRPQVFVDLGRDRVGVEVWHRF